jgi:hypothetical protein
MLTVSCQGLAGWTASRRSCLEVIHRCQRRTRRGDWQTVKLRTDALTHANAAIESWKGSDGIARQGFDSMTDNERYANRETARLPAHRETPL